ncbi:PAS domain S-box protein [Candidatus Uabimicrobium sp. HlEnr_7]|uniref:PAS domain S-box protein n=1 Tax=Candidatus Uabimicrobium helgolandensis TaxID=3095367 RepID=UPI0035570AAA
MFLLNIYDFFHISVAICSSVIFIIASYVFYKNGKKTSTSIYIPVILLLTLMMLNTLTSIYFPNDTYNYLWIIDGVSGFCVIGILAILLKDNNTRFDQDLMEEYNIFFNSSVDLFCIATFDGYFQKVNSSWEKMLGYTKQELYSSRFIEFVHPDDREATMNELAKIRKGYDVLSFENRYLSKNGEYRHLHWNSRANIQRQLCYATARDITQERKDVASLDRAKSQIKTIFQAFPDAMILQGVNREIVMFNDKFSQMFGYKGEEALGKTLSFLYAEDYINQSKIFEPLNNIQPHEVKYSSKDGSVFTCEIVSTKVTNSTGELLGYLTFLRDISKRKKTQEELKRAKEIAEKANSAKSDFLANMSHEIRTPMNGIMGTTGLLLETSLSHEQKECVDIIRISSENLLTIINDILDFSKIEAGKMHLEIHDFDLLCCIEDAIDLFSSKVIERNLQFIYNIDIDIPYYLRGDITRIRQILVNLLSNAAKFTQNGSITTSVKLQNQTDSSIELLFSVKDQGLGIDEEKIAYIFSPFLQAHVGEYQSGTGLGLSICKRLVEMMHGKIWCENNKDYGCTFFFTIRIENAQSSNNDTWHLRKELPQTLCSKILFFDERQECSNISKRLKNWGFSVCYTSRFSEICEAISDQVEVNICIVASDNIEAIKKLQTKNCPIIWIANIKNKHNENIYTTHSPVKHSNFFKLFFELCLNTKGKPSLFTTKTQEINKKLAKQLPLRILIAEDNSVNQVIATRILQKMGYIPDVVGNGLEVLSALDKKEYDIVFMDIRMPEMDGLETTRRLAKKKGRPTIIAMTANAMSGDREYYLEIGMDDYISKPITLESIEEILCRWGRKTRRWRKMRYQKESNTSLEKDKLTTLKQISTAAVEEVIDLYLNDSSEYIQKLHIALKGTNNNEIEHISHSLKGASASVGAIKMQKISDIIEKSAQKNDLLPMESLLQDLQQEYNKVYHEMNRFKEET